MKKINFKRPRRVLYPILLVLILVYYYIFLPPLHYASGDFWLFMLAISIGVLLIELVNDGVNLGKNLRDGIRDLSGVKISKKYKVMFGFWGIILVIGLVSHLVFSPVFMSKKYSSMINVETKDFKEDFPESDVNQIPLVDRDTAMRLGNRRLGSLTDIVSQFEVADDYTQINIDSYPYRVSPLEYVDFFRWLNNFQDGIPHYIQVDNVTGEVEIKTPEKPIKYSYSDKLFRYVPRALRIRHPFAIFDNPTFEVDDEGNPYYVASTYKRNFFLREPEVSGVITLNAMTGETKRYELGEIPEWIDRVYSADLVLHQIRMRGHYQNGFWNSIFAKEGVTEPTEGYNYLPIGDDLYLYTGITSVVADESNIGFMLVNLRTKDTTFYPLSAAEEYSAMQSAEGSVQETNYKATFPLLISLEGHPMYILTLKDNSGLIKEYALVDVENYQRVYVAPSVSELMTKYAQSNSLDIKVLEGLGEIAEFSGKVDQVQAVVADGETVYYFMFDGEVYKAPVKLNDHLPFLEAGQTVEFTATENGEVQSIEWEGAEPTDPAELAKESSEEVLDATQALEEIEEN